MTKTTHQRTTPIHDRIQAEMLDSFDEELELEIDDDRLDALTNEISDHTAKETVDRRVYFKELFRLQGELVKLQSWVQHHKLKVVVIFEGRDSAGKGGVIKRITQRLNPRVCRVAALPAPNERERTQWYFQRYVSHLPAGGEIVLFDRSWYNRAGVERVMGFCTEDDVEEFFRSVPEFERMLVRSGIILIKYWFSITDEEQHLRFTMRIHDPLKQWKLSPMDVEARSRWEQYTKAKEAMLEHTHIPEAPWRVVEAVDKKKARLNCIAHLLEQIPYQEIRTTRWCCRRGCAIRIITAADSARNVRAGALLSAGPTAGAEQVDLKHQRVQLVVLVQQMLQRGVGNDAAVPEMIGADLDHRQRRRQRAARHHVLGADHLVLVVEVEEIAAQHVDGADREMNLARIDEIEVDQFEQCFA